MSSTAPPPTRIIAHGQVTADDRVIGYVYGTAPEVVATDFAGRTLGIYRDEAQAAGVIARESVKG